MPDSPNPLRLVRKTRTLPTGPTKDPAEIMSLGEAMAYAKTVPDPKWVVPGFVTDGLTLFAGASKIGKSYISLDIAAAVASGTECLGSVVVEQGDVLYIAAEDPMKRIVDRMMTWNPNPEDWPMDTLSIKAVPLEKAGSLYALDWLETTANPRLIILDTLARTIPEKNTQKGAYEKDVERLAGVQRFSHQHGVAVLAVTHTNQMKLEDGDDWMMKVTGTTGIIGTADQIMFLEAKRGDAEGTLHVTGRDVSDRSDTMRRVGPWWQTFAGPLRGALGDRSVEIVDWVCAQDAPVSPADVGDALELPHNTVRTYLGRMVSANRLSKYGRGQYWKPEVYE
jgi:hypothetical protein